MQKITNSTVTNTSIIGAALADVQTEKQVQEAFERILNGTLDLPVTADAATPLMNDAVEAVWKNASTEAGFVLDSNPELYRQYGRACALLSSSDWTQVGEWARNEFIKDSFMEWLNSHNIEIPTSTVEGSEIVKVRFLREVDGRLIAAAVAINTKGTLVPEVYEWNAELGGWEYHKITHLSRSKTFAYATSVGERNHTPWTKYHILAVLLNGVPAHFMPLLRGDFMQMAEEAARKQAWSSAGFDWRDFPAA